MLSALQFKTIALNLLEDPHRSIHSWGSKALFKLRFDICHKNCVVRPFKDSYSAKLLDLTKGFIDKFYSLFAFFEALFLTKRLNLQVKFLLEFHKCELLFYRFQYQIMSIEGPCSALSTVGLGLPDNHLNDEKNEVKNTSDNN